MRTAIIGCGNIGSTIAEYIARAEAFELYGLSDTDNKQFNTLAAALGMPDIRHLTLEEAVREADLVIEAANSGVVEHLLRQPELDQPGKRLLVMSTGGLIPHLERLSGWQHGEIHIPSGAIAGLDAIKAVAGQIDQLSLTTTKPPAGLANAPFIREKGIDPEHFRKPMVIFEGGLREAIAGFPKNINVAASLYIASGFEGLNIRIIADPAARCNRHRVLCEGRFGQIDTTTENLPSSNPKTSYLACLSAIASIRGIRDRLKIG